LGHLRRRKYVVGATPASPLGGIFTVKPAVTFPFEVNF
jgi:hypothetical protein